MNSFYLEDELKELGFKEIGNNVLISRKCSIYNADKISIGNNVRIDDFCLLSGKIKLHNYVHIAAYSAIFAGDVGVEMMSYTGLSAMGLIYATSDDYSGCYMTNPTIPDKYKNIIKGKVVLEEHALIGARSTLLPGVHIGKGTAVGSCSLVTCSLDPWSIYVGTPCKKIKERSKDLLALEKELNN